MNAHDEDSNARRRPAAEPHGPVPPTEPHASALTDAHAPESTERRAPEPADTPDLAEPQELTEPTEPRELTEPAESAQHTVSQSLLSEPPVSEPPALILPTIPTLPTGPPFPPFPPLAVAPATPTPAVPPPTGVAALSLRYQIAAALALAVVAVAACVHLGMVFLHVAPSNTVTKQHGRAIDDWVYPEFEQNWKLFAPNPLQQNIAVQVRAEVRLENGSSRETGWYDLSALDGAAIDGNLLPSHTQQNELRRAWDFYVATHDNENRPAALRGALSEAYLRRIVVQRLGREEAGGKGAVVERVQVRSRTTNVPSPKWSEEKVSDRPVLRELPWWAVPQDDRSQARTATGTAPLTATGPTARTAIEPAARTATKPLARTEASAR